MPFYFDDMKYIRELKNKFLKNTDNKNLDKLFFKYNRYYQSLFIKEKPINMNDIYETKYKNYLLWKLYLKIYDNNKIKNKIYYLENKKRNKHKITIY